MVKLNNLKGREEKLTKSKKTNRKKSIALACIGVLTILGGTLAYFTTSDEIANSFSTAKYEAKVVETFNSPDTWTPGTTTNKTVTVTNNGNVPMALRASYTEKWTDANGNNLSLKDSSNNTAAVINFNTGWAKDSDGYYYYGTKSALTKLNAGQTSSSFISGVTFNENIESTLTRTVSADGKTITYSSAGNGYDNAHYTLTIKVETVQYDQASSVWN